MVVSDLNEGENSFRRLAENLPGIVYRVLIEDDNRKIFFNDMVQTMTGYSSEELKKGKVCSIDPLILPEDKLNVISIVKDAIEKNAPFEVEYRINNKNGELKWFFERGRPIRGDNGNPSYIDGVIFDITNQKEAEKNLKREKLFTEEALNAQRDTFFVFDPSSGKAIRWNNAFREISGYSDEEILAMRAPDSYYDEKDLQRAADATRIVEEKSISYVNMDLITKDGNSIPFEYIGSSITDEEGNLKYIVSVGRDITEKKELEQIKANLINRFSHEFKTPLLSIMGFTELLMIMYKDKQDEELNDYIGRIVEGAKRLKSLIDSFIEISYIDEKLVEINFSQVNVSKLVRIILNEMEGIITLRNQEITMNFREDLVATADKEKIRLIISNLVMNAINFTPKGGKISINSNIIKDFITISVKDNGIGLNKEEKSVLFKPFGKIERYGQGWDVVPDGMGMGLYITKELVELHKGTIWAESGGRNKGSTFNVKIPINQ